MGERVDVYEDIKSTKRRVRPKLPALRTSPARQLVTSQFTCANLQKPINDAQI